MENTSFVSDDHIALTQKSPEAVRRNTTRKTNATKDPETGIHTSKPSSALKPEVGLVGGVSLIIGTMIGSGIFASASGVFAKAGSTGLGLVTWGLCGVISMLGALCYGELGTMIVKSGAEYAYLKAAFGNPVGFLYAHTSTILLKPSQVAIISLAFGQYVIEPFFPLCSIIDPGRVDLKITVKILAALCIGVIMFVNCFSVRWATRMQIIFTASKLIAIAMLIITGLVRLGQGYTSSFNNSFVGTTTSIGMVGFAFYNGLWAYDGWNNLNYVTEEMKNPYRDLPRSILIGIPLVTICYVLVNISYLSVLTPDEVKTSGAVAVTLADRMYGVMAWTIPIFVACSTFGAANGSAFSGGRLVYVAAREGHLPEFLAMVHTKRHTPLPAMLFNSFIAWMMLIPDSSSFETLINYFSFAAWVFYGGTISALLWLRYKKPGLERPYKVPLIVPVVVLLASIYLVVAPFYEAPLESFYCLLFILSGIPFYLAFVYFKCIPKWFLNGAAALTYKLQMLCDVALPESENQIASA